jgi:Zn-dependent M28 family amino/carboxypeptidase
MPKRWFLIAALALAAIVIAVPATTAAPPDPTIVQSMGFRKAVTLGNIRAHQQALQAIGTANGGNRLAGTAGHDQSAEYVYNELTEAGYSPSYQEFTFQLVSDRTPPQMQQISPTATTYTDGPDFQTMQYSGSGDVTANLWAVDVNSPSTGGSTSGCEGADFAGFPAGDIALMQRGTCTFAAKTDNAFTAGAAAVIIFNEGNSPDREGVLSGTLAPPRRSIPSVGTTFAIGEDLRNGVTTGNTGTVMRVRTDTIAENRTTENVIAETAGGGPNRVVVIGAHLDSVSRGPGINDNGSGSATILEVAKVYAQQGRTPRNKLRFAWWSAEEEGLIGSTEYVASLSQAEKDQILLNLNFDMVGSPNFVRFVYDGDNSAFPAGVNGVQAGPAGSGLIEDVFTDYFDSKGLASEPTPFNGRSDYGPFIAEGIPAGGLFTGAEGIKTAAEAVTYGGTAGQPYDPCYHLACDTYANNSNTGLDQMSDAVAHAVLFFANTKSNVDANPAAATLRVARSSGTLHTDANLARR